MAGLGTICNVFGVLVGGICGMVFGQKVSNQAQNTLMVACGISTIFLGIAGAMSGMLTTDGQQIVSGQTMLVIGSIALGGLFGEWLDIEKRMEHFGMWLKKISNNEKDAQFVDGFVTCSLTICIGAMAIVGSIQDGLLHDPSTLIAKGILDFIIVMVMSASKGKGCIFAAIPVGIFQGFITITATWLHPIMTVEALANLSLVGSILIFCVGVNLVWGKMVKVANLLPAVIFAALFAMFV